MKVPVNARLSLDEVIQILNDSCSVALITTPVFAQALTARRAQVPALRLIVALGDEGGDVADLTGIDGWTHSADSFAAGHQKYVNGVVVDLPYPTGDVLLT